MRIYGNTYSFEELRSMILSGTLAVSDLDDKTLSFLIDCEGQMLVTDDKHGTALMADFLLDAERRNNFYGKEVVRHQNFFLKRLFRCVGWNTDSHAFGIFSQLNQWYRELTWSAYNKRAASFSILFIIVFLLRVTFVSGSDGLFGGWQLERLNPFDFGKEASYKTDSDDQSLYSSGARYYSDISLAFETENIDSPIRTLVLPGYDIEKIYCFDTSDYKCLQLQYKSNLSEYVAISIKNGETLVASAHKNLFLYQTPDCKNITVSYESSDGYGANIILNTHICEILCSDKNTLDTIIKYIGG